MAATIAANLERDAHAGLRVNVYLTTNAADLALAKGLRAAGVHVTMVTTQPDAVLVSKGNTAFLNTGVGGVAVTSQASVRTLNQVITHAGRNKAFGGEQVNGVIASPGAGPALRKVLLASRHLGPGPGTLVAKTGHIHSIMVQDTLANLAKAGVKITFVKGAFTGTAIITDGGYGVLCAGNLDYHGIIFSEQVGLVFGGTTAQDLAARL